MAKVFIGVGSNEGDRLATISSAIKQLGRLPGIAVTQMATSSKQSLWAALRRVPTLIQSSSSTPRWPRVSYWQL